MLGFCGTGVRPDVMALPALSKRDNVLYPVLRIVGQKQMIYGNNPSNEPPRTFENIVQTGQMFLALSSIISSL
jgi:hypothetical protein